MGTTATYQALVTSQHQDKPNFMAAIALLCSASADQQAVLAAMPALFDITTATSTQLDQIGVWVGLGRTLFVPGLGTTTLIDADYRVLLSAKIAANHWDGGMQTLQTILAGIFPGSITLFAVDNQNMSMDIYISGGTISATQLALLKGGLLVPKPEGVRINGYLSVGIPLFGLDFNNSSIGGLDYGSFVTYL